jgi:hypothetical protein
MPHASAFPMTTRLRAHPTRRGKIAHREIANPVGQEDRRPMSLFEALIDEAHRYREARPT